MGDGFKLGRPSVYSDLPVLGCDMSSKIGIQKANVKPTLLNLFVCSQHLLFDVILDYEHRKKKTKPTKDFLLAKLMCGGGVTLGGERVLH